MSFPRDGCRNAMLSRHCGCCFLSMMSDVNNAMARCILFGDVTNEQDTRTMNNTSMA